MQNDNSILNLEYLNEDDYETWNEFVISSSQGTFFNTTQWLDLLCFVYHRSYKILTCRKQEEIKAGIVFFENHRFFWRMITPIYLLPFNGPLFAEIHDGKYQKSIAKQLNLSTLLIDKLKCDYHFILLDTHYSAHDMRSFQWKNFRVEPNYSYLCKLENEKELFAGFNQSLRKKLRKISTKNVQMIESNNIDLFAELYNASYSQHKMRPPIKVSLLKVLIEKILQLENVHLYVAEIEGKQVAGRIVLTDDQIVYDLLAGSIDQTGLASTFLATEIMKKYVENFSYFDFMGAGHPEIEQFKRGFGGKLVHGFRAVSQTSILLSLMLKVRQSVQQAGRRM